MSNGVRLDFLRDDDLQSVKYFVEDLLLSLAFRSSLSGTYYLRDAVVYCCFSNKDKLNFREDVYPAIAKEYQTTSARVNRAIRHTINVCFDDGRLKSLNEIFRCPLVSNVFAPTNAELITTLALLIRRLISVDADGNVVIKKITFPNGSLR